MKYVIILFLLISLSSFSQENGIEITLKNDSIIKTQWIHLKYNSILNKPYVRIHDKNGPKIRVVDISKYMGYDQNENFRQFQNLSFKNKRKFCFSEMLFSNDSSQNVRIYFNELTFGRNDFFIKKNKLKYKLNDNPIKIVSYLNVQNDFSNLTYKSKDFNKARQLRIAQTLSVITGAILIGELMRDNLVVANGTSYNTEDKMKFICGGLLLTLPLTLEKTKQKHLVNALMHFK